jgi:hypothetical protein
MENFFELFLVPSDYSASTNSLISAPCLKIKIQTTQWDVTEHCQCPIETSFPLPHASIDFDLNFHGPKIYIWLSPFTDILS